MSKVYILFGLLFLIGCNTPKKEEDNKEEGFDSQMELPLNERFSFEDLEGNKIDLSDTKGKLVFINFWATWCKPCVKEMPSISEAYIQLKDQNVVFLIASDEEVEKIKKFESKHHYSFKLIHSSASVFELDVKALPTTIILNENGDIVFNEIGARDWSSDKNIKLILSFFTKL